MKEQMPLFEGTVLELLAREDQPLLILPDALLGLHLGLHGVDGVRSLDIQRDGLAGQRLDEDLHADVEAQHQGRLLLDVVVRQGAAYAETPGNLRILKVFVGIRSRNLRKLAKSIRFSSSYVDCGLRASHL